jgi:hypothetical protein
MLAHNPEFMLNERMADNMDGHKTPPGLLFAKKNVTTHSVDGWIAMPRGRFHVLPSS